MDINLLISSVSESLTKISMEQKLNSYNFLAVQNDKKTYQMLLDKPTATAESGLSKQLNIGYDLKEKKMDVDQVMLDAIDISSRHNKLIALLNSRIGLEKLTVKGR